MIIKKPKKKKMDPYSLFLRQKKLTVCFTPTREIMPIINAN